MAKREFVVFRGCYRLVWQSGTDKRTYDVYVDQTCVMNWSYPKVPDHSSLMANAIFWTDQAVLQAKAETVKCMDCDRDTIEIGHYYMLNDALWLQIATREGARGMLCLDCAEKRLGKPLTGRDFKRCEQNDKSEIVQAIIKRATKMKRGGFVITCKVNGAVVQRFSRPGVI